MLATTDGEISMSMNDCLPNSSGRAFRMHQSRLLCGRDHRARVTHRTLRQEAGNQPNARADQGRPSPVCRASPSQLIRATFTPHLFFDRQTLILTGGGTLFLDPGRTMCR